MSGFDSTLRVAAALTVCRDGRTRHMFRQGRALCCTLHPPLSRVCILFSRSHALVGSDSLAMVKAFDDVNLLACTAQLLQSGKQWLPIS